MATFTASILSQPPENHTGIDVQSSVFVVTPSVTNGDIVLVARIPHHSIIFNWHWQMTGTGTGIWQIGTSASASAIATAVSLTGLQTAARVTGVSPNRLPILISLSDDANPRWIWIQAAQLGVTSTTRTAIFTIQYAKLRDGDTVPRVVGA